MSQSIERLAVLPSGFSAALLSSREAGSESWWQQLAGLGTPLVEALDEARVTATFFGVTRRVMSITPRRCGSMPMSTA